MKSGYINILTINGGSSSIKFAICEMAEIPNKKLAGQIIRIGLPNTVLNVTEIASGKKDHVQIDSRDFKESAEFLINWLKEQNYIDQISCVGHRIVLGMEHTNPEIINDSLLKELYKISEYDPDHLPAEIEIIEIFKREFPLLFQVASYDTSFHSTMPRVAKIFPIPRRFDQKGIRRYGFHGLSFAYLMGALKKFNGSDKSKGKIILAHLGNGASLAAVKDGRSVDTTMGFTPAGGLMMGTRPGDIDPGIAWYLMQIEQLSADQFNHLINHESGLLGVSEISSDIQDLLEKEDSDIRAAEAVALFCYQVRKWIGAFVAVLNGLDTLVFSGGIGENAPKIRLRICKEFDYLGIEIDEDENTKNSTVISKINSKVKVCVIPTDEELMIAKNTGALYFKAGNIQK